MEFEALRLILRWPFRQETHEDKKKGWTVISVKNDWKQIFAFEK